MQTFTVRQSPMSANTSAATGMETFFRDVMRPWAAAFESWRGGVEDVMARNGSRSQPGNGCLCGCDCGCGCSCGCRCAQGDCRPDPCQCSCCVADSDLVIEARVGEQRVIPIVIENKWRRERDIEVQLSDWSCACGDLAINGRIIDPLKFTIEPCGEHRLTLVVNVGQPEGGKDPKGTAARTAKDVGNCVVCYADLRIKGCSNRPIRIAVAVLPGECGAFTVDCCQGCC